MQRTLTMRAIVLAGLISLWAAPGWAQGLPAPAHDGCWPLHLALGTYMTAAFADVSQTAYCLGQGTCREVNPAAKWLMDRHGVVPPLILKGAINTTVAAFLLHDHAKHPKRAFWLAVLAASVQTAAVIHNARVMRRVSE